MPSIYRISQPGRGPVVPVEAVESIEDVVKAGSPGCYHIDEISRDPLHSGHTSRRRGTTVRQPDDQCTLDLNPQPSR
jgi:hypothetical protein